MLPLCCSLHVLFVAAASAVPSSVACAAATHMDATIAVTFAVTFAAVLYFCCCCCCIQSAVCGCCLPLHILLLAPPGIKFSLVVLPKTSAVILQSPQDTFSNIRERALLAVGVFSRQSLRMRCAITKFLRKTQICQRKRLSNSRLHARGACVACVPYQGAERRASEKLAEHFSREKRRAINILSRTHSGADANSFRHGKLFQS